MNELDVTVDVDECNFITSNLYVIKAMSIITERLMDDYQDKVDTAESYLKTNETTYATEVVSLNTAINKYQVLVETYDEYLYSQPESYTELEM